VYFVNGMNDDGTDPSRVILTTRAPTTAPTIFIEYNSTAMFQDYERTTLSMFEEAFGLGLLAFVCFVLLRSYLLRTALHYDYNSKATSIKGHPNEVSPITEFSQNHNSALYIGQPYQPQPQHGMIMDLCDCDNDYRVLEGQGTPDVELLERGLSRMSYSSLPNSEITVPECST
jgi:hypothetical protein